MKKIVSIALALVMFLLCFAGCNQTFPAEETTTPLYEETSEDFSFSLTWGTYGVSSYDSVTGKLVKTKDATNPDDYITTYMMSEDELKFVYNIIRELDIESYPDEYDPQNGGKSEPSMTIVLIVHTSDLDKTITAKDIMYGFDANTDKGQAFLDTVKAIRDILMETDEWKALPDYEFYYE